MLDMSTVKSQRRIVNGEHVHCQVLLMSGKTLDLEKPISEFPLEPDIDIGKKSKFLNRLNQKMAKGE